MEAKKNQPTLHHPDAALRLEALTALAEQGDIPAVCRAASSLLADPDPGVRELSARLLTRMGSEDSAKQIARYIASQDITIRNLAGEVLSQMGPPAIDALAAYIHHAHHDVRKFAVDVLALMPAAHLSSEIAKLLEDDDQNVVLSAVDALGTFHATDYADALRGLFHREPFTRPSVIAAFGAFGTEGDLAFIATALSDEDPVVQLAAAEALAAQDTPAAIPILLRKVNAVAEMARPIVLKALVDLWDRHPERVEPLPLALKPMLREMLDDTDAEYRRAAAMGLREFLDDATVDALLLHTGEQDTYDLTVLNILTRYPTAFVRISNAVETRVMPVETGAHFVLGLLASGALPGALHTAAGHFLSAHFRSYTLETQLAVLSYCGQMNTVTFAPVFRAGLMDEDASVQALAAEFAPAEASVPAALPTPLRSAHPESGARA